MILLPILVQATLPTTGPATAVIAAGASLVDFYHKAQFPLLAGMLALASAAWAALNYITKLKETSYDTDEYHKIVAELQDVDADVKVMTGFDQLRKLNISVAIAALIAGLLQVTVGFLSSTWSTAVCLAVPIVVVFAVLYELSLIWRTSSRASHLAELAAQKKIDAFRSTRDNQLRLMHPYRPSMLRRLIATLLILLIAPRAQAWNVAGHEVAAAIAFEVLKREDPAALARVLDALKKHPSFADHFADKLATRPEDERDLFLFMLAARWPDDVRKTRLDHPTWHYIDYPYKPAGQPDTVVAKPPEPENIISAYTANLATVKDAKDAPGDKAIALCWVMHLAGDAHQPLHCVQQYTTDYPTGDRGGNLIYVRAKAGRAILDLHKLWDGLILGSSKFTDVRKVADELRARPEFARKKLPELADKDFVSWTRVSFKIAVRDAYLDGKPLGSPTRDDDTPVVPAGYLDKAKTDAERQVMLAGYRLADALREVK